MFSQNKAPIFEIKFGGKNKMRKKERIYVNDFIGVKSSRARGKRLSIYEINKIIEIKQTNKEPEFEVIKIDENDNQITMSLNDFNIK